MRRTLIILAYRGVVFTALGALAAGCGGGVATSPDPTLWNGFIALKAQGIWNISATSNSGAESGAETLIAECYQDGKGGGKFASYLEMENVLTTVDNNVTATSVNNYYGTNQTALNSSNIGGCRVSLDLSNGAFAVTLDLTQFPLNGSGSTVAQGVTLPLAIPADQALVELTSGSTPIESAQGPEGCVPVTGNLTIGSGDIPGAAAQPDNPRQIPMTFTWNYLPVNCGHAWDFGATPDFGNYPDTPVPSDLAESGDLL